MITVNMFSPRKPKRNDRLMIFSPTLSPEIYCAEIVTIEAIAMLAYQASLAIRRSKKVMLGVFQHAR